MICSTSRRVQFYLLLYYSFIIDIFLVCGWLPRNLVLSDSFIWVAFFCAIKNLTLLLLCIQIYPVYLQYIKHIGYESKTNSLR